MKKIIALALALVASSASAAVDGTPHDLASGSIGVCQYCHMPHNSLAVSGVPLWSRALRTSLTLYTSSRISNATINLSNNSYSLLCMSCHDGQVSMGTLHNGQTLPFTGALDANTNVGTTLTNDHPVGLAYPVSGTLVTESGLVTLSAATAAGYVFFGTSNYIECGSCHDPHRWSSLPSNDLYKFKRDVTAADFCAGCHGTK